MKDEARRFNVVNCGRRWGKTVLGIDRLLAPAIAGHPAAWFAPTYKYLIEPWREARQILSPIVAAKNEQEKQLRLITGGVVDFWTLDDPNSGRGRKYTRAVVDEAAMARNLEEAWTKAIRPTLADYRGDAWFLSTPKGRNFFWRIYTKGLDPAEAEWAAWSFPTRTNKVISEEEIEAARLELPDRVFRQEFLAEFIEESGGVFRGVAESVDEGRSADEPPRADTPYFMGVDLARVEDFTVLSVVDEHDRQVAFERFNQISWERQIAAIVALADRYRADVILDSTGVGDPIFERLRDAGLAVTPYQFTASSKPRLIDHLAMRIERGEARNMDLPVQTAELMAFEYQMTPSRHVRMNAPEGMHDDCVIARALASWGATGGVQRIRVL